MRIAIITGSRADRGPLEMVYAAIDKACADDWRVFPLKDGGRYRQNFYHRMHYVRWIDITPPAVLKPNFGSDVVQVAAAAATQISGELSGITTDLVIAHGDRYEILGAVMGANMMGVPIAHLAGGDVTEGSADDCYRHAITKLSHIHFPNCDESASRLLQMGEEPERIHMVGDPAVDRILKTPLLDRPETFRAVGLLPPHRALLVSFHPDTMGNSGETLNALLGALKEIAGDIGIVLIGPNADPGHKRIELAWQLLASAQPNAVYCPDLPGDVFLSLLKHCDAMVGNSSSGFYEAPNFALPVINIGDRQKGRPRANCILQADTEIDILYLINKVVEVGKPTHAIINPYGDGHAAERIAEIIGKIGDPKFLLRKRFQTIELGRHSSKPDMGDVPQRASGEIR